LVGGHEAQKIIFVNKLDINAKNARADLGLPKKCMEVLYSDLELKNSDLKAPNPNFAEK
jgi:hypothetical protein